jgi:hypothetical protein
MNSMLHWLIILLIVVLIYYLWPKKKVIKEKFQNQYDENTPPINLNVTVSPTLLNSAREELSNITNNQDSSNPATSIQSICIKLQNDLSYFNSELQRHRNEGNWTHTHAMRSYIDSINKQISISGC